MDNKKHFRYRYFLFSGCLVMYILLLWTYISNYLYKHPFVPDLFSFFFQTVLNLLLPIIAGIFFLIVEQKGKYKQSICALLAFLVLWCVCFARGTSELLFSPTICSFTNDTDEFGVFDKRFAGTLALNPVDYFPQEIPENVTDVRYCYFYEFSSCEKGYVAISWTYDDPDDFAKEMSNFSKQHPNQGDFAFYFTDSFYGNAVFFDNNTQTVAYVIVTTSTMDLPTAMEEVFSEIYHYFK